MTAEEVSEMIQKADKILKERPEDIEEVIDILIETLQVILDAMKDGPDCKHELCKLRVFGEGAKLLIEGAGFIERIAARKLILQALLEKMQPVGDTQ
jgi:hypothetical protein